MPNVATHPTRIPDGGTLHALLRRNYSERELSTHPEITAFALAENGIDDPRAIHAGRTLRIPSAAAADVVAHVAERPSLYRAHLDTVARDRTLGRTSAPSDGVLRQVDYAQVPTTRWVAGATRLTKETVCGASTKRGADRTLEATWSFDELTFPDRDGRPVHLLPAAKWGADAFATRFTVEANASDWSASRSVRPLGQRGRGASEAIFTVSAEVTEGGYEGGAHPFTSSYARTFDLKAAADPNCGRPVIVCLNQLASEDHIAAFTQAIADRLEVSDFSRPSLDKTVRTSFTLSGNTATIHVPYHFFASETARGSVTTFDFDLSNDPVFIRAQRDGLTESATSLASSTMEHLLRDHDPTLSPHFIDDWLLDLAPGATSVFGAIEAIRRGDGIEGADGARRAMDTLDAAGASLPEDARRTARVLRVQLRDGPAPLLRELEATRTDPSLTKGDIHDMFTRYAAIGMFADADARHVGRIAARDMAFGMASTEANEALAEIGRTIAMTRNAFRGLDG